jgi:ribose 5-phosphate isomerase B
MNIHIGSDHAGFLLKEDIKYNLTKNNEYNLIDHGTFTQDSVDYPDFAKSVSKEVLQDNNSIGILICGTGIGISIVANKIKGIRCALCLNEKMAELSRQHNNANILALGARFGKNGDNITNDNFEKYSNDILKIINKFIKTPFSNEERHINRIKKFEI